jgi:predicted  nucleic acid-binding Zn-ribbon protein
MSEERFDRLESQLSQVIQGMTVIQQNMTTKQDLATVEQKVSAMQNNIDAVREDIISLRQRVESNEGTLIVAIREGFRRQEDFINDLNFDLTNNERKTRRLSRRVTRLERLDRDDD